MILTTGALLDTSAVMVDRVMASKDAYNSIPEACTYISLHDKINFADLAEALVGPV